MSKKATKTKSPAKTKDANALRRVTVHALLGKVDGNKGDGSFIVYGVAKKAVAKDTPFGTAHGIKGVFEVLHNGTTKSAKQAFLGSMAQDAIVAKLAESSAVQFGAEVSRKGEAVEVTFWTEPGAADPLTSLREAASEV